MRARLLLLMACLLLAGAGKVWALPGAPVGLDPFTIDLWETEDNTEFGIPTETPPPVVLPDLVVNGFVVLREDPNGGNDPLNWSDVVNFFDYQNRSYAQLTSDGGFTQQFITQVQNGFTGYIDEGPDDPTIYDVGNVYRIHSDVNEVEPIPEPASLILLGTGLAGMGLRRRRRSA